MIKRTIKIAAVIVVLFYFVSNILPNLIGVPLAAYHSYNAWQESGHAISEKHQTLIVKNDDIKCEDLLKKYASKPQNVEFIECKRGEGQTILEAIYKVKGENSKEVEKLLIEKYGIGKLKFACCGWESNNGHTENQELKNINQNYILEIIMNGNAEKVDEKGNTYLELDRNKVDFYVIVKLLEI